MKAPHDGEYTLTPAGAARLGVDVQRVDVQWMDHEHVPGSLTEHGRFLAARVDSLGDKSEKLGATVSMDGFEETAERYHASVAAQRSGDAA